jgi:hypothetical protein
LTVRTPSTQGPMTLTVFSFIFLSLITQNSLSQFSSKVKHLFALPAHKLVESVIPLIMLLLAQADYLSASCADFFIAAAEFLVKLAHPYLFIFCCHFSHNSKQSITILFKSQHFISSVAWLILRICLPRPCVQPILSLACCGLPLQRLGSLDLLAFVAKRIAHA